MAKTIVQKIGSPDPDVSVFKIIGTLGFHENSVLVKFFDECSSRNIRRLVLDLSELDSLGGGCARIIRDAVRDGGVQVCVAGASRTVHDFLSGKGDSRVLFAPDLEGALSGFRGSPASPSETDHVRQTTDGRRTGAASPASATAGSAVRSPKSSTPPAGRSMSQVNAGYVRDVITEVDDLLGDPPAGPSDGPSSPAAETRVDARARTDRTATACAERERPVAQPTDDTAAEFGELKRRVARYRALFSLNKEFSRIEDKSRLLDAFLLTIVAQVGVESAAFLDLAHELFTAACWKGFETADPESLNIRCDEVDTEAWLRSPEILPIKDTPICAEARSRVEKWDLPFAAPFIVHEKLRGIVLLGKPIRRELDADAWEFLSMMFNQVAIAYENSCRLEKQNKRTLGLVQSLMGMIESNTVSRGTTEMVMDLTYAVAIKMHYPEEHLRDLLYGTVLRDIGMLSLGNYVVKSPRELVPEEWEIIKKHPAEGAVMLEKMSFSEHACSVVRSHHERYNGEGYPDGLTGQSIPLGARILSVVESYAAMLHDRPNRPALTTDEALNALVENWGLKYDPEVVKVFSQTLEEDARNGGKVPRAGIDLFKA